jgi:hypothetical protein
VLGVPVPASGKPAAAYQRRETPQSAAEDYRVNPGLHDQGRHQKYFETNDAQLDELLMALEKQGRQTIPTKKGIELAKATYDGFNKAHPPEYYRWFIR